MEGLGRGIGLVMLTNLDLRRYDRQIRLPEFGIDAQERLKKAKVLVVGAGGLGCPVLLYLASAGVGSIGVVDNDIVNFSNLQRQVLFSEEDVGKFKVKVVKEKLEKHNSLINIISFNERLNVTNTRRILEPFDIIVDGSDNFATRYLVNDACVEMDKPFVSGAIFKFEGQVSVFNWCNETGLRGPTYRCVFPEPPQAIHRPACAEIGVLGVMAGTIGILQANEVLKMVTGIGSPLNGEIMLVNILNSEFKKVKIKRDQVIAQSTKVLPEESYLELCKEAEMNGIKEIDAKSLKTKLDAKEDIFLLDVREPFEREICSIGGELIPVAQVASRLEEIPKDRTIVVYCRSGGRSRRVTESLKAKGFEQVLNLSGGILGWIDQVDSSLQKY